MKKIFLLLFLALNMTYSIYGQIMEFTVLQLQAGPTDCNWMFQAKDNEAFVQNITPSILDQFAYHYFTWSTVKSSSSCSSENTNVVNGVAGIKIKLVGFTLGAFHHINTSDPDLDWKVMGQAGDERVYVNGKAYITYNNVKVLQVDNCILSVSVPYSTAAELNQIYGYQVMTQNVGTGGLISGGGRGTLNPDSSDVDWYNAFNINGNSQVTYTLNTNNFAVQYSYGYYDFAIDVFSAQFVENIDFFNIPNSKAIPEPKVLSGAKFTFNSEPIVDIGGLRTIYANKIIKDPGTNGSLPSGVNNISTQYYWQIGTTYKTYDVDLTFDITDLTGVSDYNNLTVLHRENSAATWKECTSVSVNSTNKTITAAGLKSFSEFVVASKSTNNPLPVELVSFKAEGSNGGVCLTWNTATEINNYGFEIERKLSSANNWNKIGFVAGNGNSNSNKFYSYTDKEQLNGKYSYRLKQLDNNGEYEYSNTIEVNVNSLPNEYVLNQNYPNPFNPSTTISFSIPEKQFVSLKIYDVLGNEVSTLVNEELEAGNYNKIWNSSSINGKVASGVYFYKLSAGSYVETKKMNLMK